MKKLRIITLIATIGLSLTGSLVRAGDASGSASSPVVVGQGKNSGNNLGDLNSLIQKFQSERDAYLAQQSQLKTQIKDSTTPAQRAALRKLLEKNHKEFLDDLKRLREDLKEMVSQLKGKLNNAELQRLIDAAKNGGDGHHRGQH